MLLVILITTKKQYEPLNPYKISSVVLITVVVEQKMIQMVKK